MSFLSSGSFRLLIFETIDSFLAWNGVWHTKIRHNHKLFMIVDFCNFYFPIFLYYIFLFLKLFKKFKVLILKFMQYLRNRFFISKYLFSLFNERKQTMKLWYNMCFWFTDCLFQISNQRNCVNISTWTA